MEEKETLQYIKITVILVFFLIVDDAFLMKAA